MKRILIVSHAMEIGGAESALLGLLECIDTEQYKVDLFLLRHTGEFMKFIPPNIHLLPEIPEYTVLARPMSKTIKEGHLGLTLARLWGKWKAKRYIHKHKFSQDNGVELEYSHKYTVQFMPEIQPGVVYDAAISFLTPHYVVADKVQAKKKLAWIHTDYSVIPIDINSERNMWGKYDHIVAISERVGKSFTSKFPGLEHNLVFIENILPQNLIYQQAEEHIPDFPQDKGISLLSIGRFSYAKNFENIPEICRSIIQHGIDVQWYLIGYGSSETLIRKKIKEMNMEKYVHILGKKTNPYPYIKQCHIYVQPSRYEGKCVAVREAQFFHKPVVITSYATAASQVENGIDGIIVPMDNKGCAEMLVQFIKNKELQEKLMENTKSKDYTNSAEIHELYEVL